MIQSFKDNLGKFRDYDSELLLMILNKASIETENGEDKELFVDENWQINTKENIDNKNLSSNSNLKKNII